jgi:molybdenum cofactor guanylyltransferase
MNPYSAILMAGGRSSRMGSDKALLLVGGQPLWKIQREKLASIADEVLISAREGILDTPVIPDQVPGLGPLGGLESALSVASHERVLVLGVDMPLMSSAYLATLLGESSADCGVVPVLGGYFQGLAAVYPKGILPLLREILRGEDHSMQQLNRLAVAEGLMRERAVSPDEALLFQNWNRPEDLTLGSTPTLL